MPDKTYSEKLRHPKWQKKRLEILKRDKFTCKYCNDNDTELHVHHIKYIFGNEPWDYLNSNFLTLCKNCHKVIEYFKDENIKAIEKETIEIDLIRYNVLIENKTDYFYFSVKICGEELTFNCIPVFAIKKANVFLEKNKLFIGDSYN